MSQPVARLTRPAEMVASLPLTLGFTPEESLVVLCCHEPRGRVGLTVRIDLPPPHLEPELVREIERLVRGQHATRVLLAIYTAQDHTEGQTDGLPRKALAAQLDEAFDDLVVTDVLLIGPERFWSYLCDDQRCCPVEGTPIDAGAGSDGVSLLAAEQVLEGRATLPSRTALAASLEGPDAAGPAEDRCAAAAQAWESRRAILGRPVARAQALSDWDAVLDRWAEGRRELSDESAAQLAVSLVDGHVRDTIAGAALTEPAVVGALLADLARRTPDDWAAPVCALYGWVTYCQGGGAAVTIALERALACDPDCSLAWLLLGLLDRQVEPEVVRDITREAMAVLRQDPDLRAAG